VLGKREYADLVSGARPQPATSRMGSFAWGAASGYIREFGSLHRALPSLADCQQGAASNFRRSYLRRMCQLAGRLESPRRRAAAAGREVSEGRSKARVRTKSRHRMGLMSALPPPSNRPTIAPVRIAAWIHMSVPAATHEASAMSWGSSPDDDSTVRSEPQ
jgi:hypothetical protein